MASFSGNGRDKNPARRNNSKASRRTKALLGIEPLEDRKLMAGPSDLPPQWTPTAQDVGDVRNGPMANAGADLIRVYQDYVQYKVQPNRPLDGFVPSNPEIRSLSGMIGVTIYGYGDTSVLANLLMQPPNETELVRPGFENPPAGDPGVGLFVTGIDANFKMIQGYVRPDQLPVLAQYKRNVGGQIIQVVSLAPMTIPKSRSQGAASNQAEDVFGLQAALAQFPGINGTGITVGILSDSINRYQGGIADSQATGDLPPSNRINVLLDEPANGAGLSDEGRAMMELMYDLLPGANFAYNTAFIDEIGFANGIRALSRQANSQVIVDDIGYATEPFYQPGPIEQAVTDVVTQDNRIYFSAAGNSADDGFESPWRSMTATIAGLTGTFFDWDPRAAAAAQIQITTTAGGRFIFQYDQPWFTSNGVTSDLDAIVIDANGAIVSTNHVNNIATQQPWEWVQIPAAGTYTMAIIVRQGPAPGRVMMVDWSSGLDFSKTFGNEGGITYPTTFGHSAGEHAIGVGAVQYQVAPPFDTTPPVTSAVYSSFGPRYLVFDAAGNRLPATQMLQRPQVSGVDNTDTTFFIPGNDFEGNGFPNFTGTSAAAPNLAALAALMRQISPNISQNDVLTALINSSIPLNGSTKGTWNPQGGYGLPQALAAFNEVDVLRVTTTTPASGATFTTLTNNLVVNFNKPINTSTVQATDLVFSQVPPGVIVTPTSVTILSTTSVRFNFTITRSGNSKANGSYQYRLADGAITSADNKTLVAFTGSFNISDLSNPYILDTTFSDRRVFITFSEPMDPNTVNSSTIQMIRTGPSGQFGQPDNVVVSSLPGATVTWVGTLGTLTNVAVIDMSAVPQSNLPNDRYGLRVSDQVTDLVGNKLDGEFSGVYPTGDRKPLPAEDTDNDTFFIDLGFLQLRGPNILFVNLDTASDTGMAGDRNTNVRNPGFVGQVTAGFPGAIAGLTVVAQFNALHNNVFDLQRGAGGRGYTVGTSVDITTTTDSQGRFSFQVPSNLPDGFHTVRVIVVGQPDQPPLPGFSTQLDQSFRVDTTNPTVATVNVGQNALINSLGAGITLAFTDPVLPSGVSPLGVPLQFQVPALNPATATNISNYRLVNLGSDNAVGGTGTAADVDYSNFIRSAVYTDTSNRTTPSSPYTGQVHLTFATGIPEGRYLLTAKVPSGNLPGVTDAAGNAIDGDPLTAGAQDFNLTFDLQPVPTYVTDIEVQSPDPTNPGQTTTTGPRDYYEIAVPGVTPRAPAPPTRIQIDFSGPLDPTLDYTNLVQLIRSFGTAKLGNTIQPDGDFGVDPLYNPAGNERFEFTRVPGTTVQLVNSVLGAQYGDPGYKNRLILDIAAGTTLPADKYRVWIPNAFVGGQDLRIFDIFRNHIDGEFLGNPTSVGGWETLLPTGQYREGISGDLVAGGSLTTGFTVAPNGNVLYVRADYVDDPFLTVDDPDGSFAKPFTTLAAEALPNTANGGDLNSASNFGTGFNRNLDLNGNGRFDRSVFFAASQLSGRGPVVIVALPTTAGDPQARTFVMQKPNQADPGKPTIPDGSASVPFNTTLVFGPGTILKMRDASLFVQNQGSAIQLRGGPNPNQQVIITSYLDDTAGGDTNRDGAPFPNGTGQRPLGGDFGGIVLRNFDDRTRAIPVAAGPDDASRVQVDGRTSLGLSGADDALSYFNQGQIRYGGGAVPQTIGFRFDGITLFNARPSITNMAIAGSVAGSGGGSSQGGISGDLDSFREDTLARGPLIRRTRVTGTSLNGIYVRAELNGTIEATDAIAYPNNPSNQGGVQNYTFDDDLPYLMVARMVLGSRLLHNTGLGEGPFGNRVYVQPGVMFKLQRGAAIDVATGASSINIGDRTYINQWDNNQSLSPTTPGFVPQKTGDARVVFTSLFDDAAFTEYVDPTTGARTRIVQPLDSDNGGTANQPTPNNVPALARWGGINAIGTARVLIDEAEFRYGGGTVNVDSGTIAQRDVLNFFGTGARAYITNNNFFDNQEGAIGVLPNNLLAADPLTPLTSGNPFFRNNLFLRNDVNGLEVIPPDQGSQPPGTWANLTVDSVWDDTDLMYALRGTIRLAGRALPTSPGPFASAELTPAIVLTIQSGLPDTPLADGSFIPKPGESALVKLLNTRDTPIGDGVNGFPFGNIDSETRGGAGFLVGIDDGADPDTDPLIDSGVMSQIRIVGLGGNETNNQPRVPVIITSLRDDTVGKTVRGIQMNVGASPQYLTSLGFAPGTPAAGDGGVIGYGANSLSDYNLFDPRGGSIIDNADIRFITRIEMQGGGWVYAWGGESNDPLLEPLTQDGGIFAKPGVVATPDGNPDPWFKFNTAKAMTISNSNLIGFSQAGVIAHRSGGTQIHIQKYPQPMQPPIARGAWPGQPVYVFMYNNVIANMPVGVRINSDIENNNLNPSPYVGVFMNNTFVGNAEGIHTEAPANNGQNDQSHVYFLAMNNIFADHTDVAVRVNGQAWGSQMLYNLFSNNANNTDLTNAQAIANPFNAQPIFGTPAFTNAAGFDFSLTGLSDAVDASISEVKTSNWGVALQPVSTQVLDGTGGIRNNFGRVLPFGGPPPQLGQPGDIVSLPGFPPNLRGFIDQWTMVLNTDPNAVDGPASTTGTYSYAPVSGERDQLGFLRQDDLTRANVGFGSRPFFDIGAFEFRELFPPHVIDVEADLPDPNNPTETVPVPLYAVGGTAGTNQTPVAIRIEVDQRLDASSVNDLTVLLQASGGDAIFGNGNSSQDRFISLSGKVAWDEATSSIVISLSSLGLSLSSDLYRITVRGSGGDVVRNTINLTLDGENTVGGLPDGAQLPLPSGNGAPGHDFFVTFSVDTNAPEVVDGSFVLVSDTGTNTSDRITNDNTPTFAGRVFDVPPPVNPLIGQTAIVDFDWNGDGDFTDANDVLNAGTGTTDGAGNFTVTFTTAVADSAYNVGPDGILGTADDTGYSRARLRIIDQNGNASDINDANALISFVVDTKGPRVTGTDPIAGTQAVVINNSISVAVALNENADPARLNSTTILVSRSGGDGTFGNGNDVSLTIGDVTREYLKTPSGAMIVRFLIPNVSVNDLYRVTLVGSGNGVTDIAGNLIDGETTFGLPSGDGTAGGDFNLDFIVLDPTLSRIIFVGPGSFGAPDGSRFNPYPTINAGITAASIGDTVAVLGGSASSPALVYVETVNLKSLVRVISADPSSTNTNVVPGLALKTVIRAPLQSNGSSIAVTASNLISLANFPTELRGFTIANQLAGGGATTPIQAASVGMSITNSDVLVDRNYFIDSGTAITIGISALARSPEISSNVIVGNINGIAITDIGGTTTGFVDNRNIQLANNTFAWNTTALSLNTDAVGPQLLDVVNNIFWQSAERTINRAGVAITAVSPNRMLVRNNLFSANGPSIASPADDTFNVGGGFNPALLNASPDSLGNFTGNPAFSSPLDPRPDAHGPGNFFLGANYDLTSASAAIDNANPQPAAATDTDFRFRGRVDIPGRGFTGVGPADVGAFEFNGTGGVGPGISGSVSSFGVARAVQTFGLRRGTGLTFVSATTTAVTVKFNGAVKKATVNPNDLLISGDGLNPSNPARAASVTWIDARTVRFNLVGEFLKSGSVQLDINGTTVRNANRTITPDLSKSIVSPAIQSTIVKPGKGPKKQPGKKNPIKKPTPIKKPGMGGLLGRLTGGNKKK